MVCVHPACCSPTLKFTLIQMFENVDKQTADSFACCSVSNYLTPISTTEQPLLLPDHY